MRLRNLVFATLFTLLVPVASGYAGTPVWKVSKGDNHLYIAGTIHVLTPSDYPLPASFDNAYGQAAQLVFETDLQNIKSPETQQQILARMVYTDGRNLRQVLNKRTFQELEQYLASRGIPAENILGLKPGMLALTLTLVELQRLGLMGAGVDEFYSVKASSDGKRLGQLETVEEQLGFIATLGDGQESELIAHTLREMKDLPGMMLSLKTAWRSGDSKRLREVALVPFRKDFPALYDKLIVKRNNAWIPRIEGMLKTGEVEFVLVGVLHLVGEEGVLAQLAARGYRVQMLE